ncbi:MAG: hypothetical protein ACJ74T_09435 [Pyrinomonadaceae bacterium]
MKRGYRIVVSAEYNPYLEWQVKLFYYSCVTRLQTQPFIIVHEMTGGARPYFKDVLKAGGIIRRAPSFRVTGWGDVYPPRNTVGTLLHAADACEGRDEFIVLCDPDMLFVREPDFPPTLAGDFYSFMDYTTPAVVDAMRRLGIPQSRLDSYGDALKCGVPYIIPVEVARPLAERWLDALDAFPPRRWIDGMYAFGLAVVSLDLDLSLNRTVICNGEPARPLAGDIIHYSYPDGSWNKRDFLTDEQARGVWKPALRPPAGTVMAEVVAQIHEAREFYRDPFSPRED